MRLDRLSRIENYIMQQKQVSLEDLAEKFQLSVNTARRDVIELENRSAAGPSQKDLCGLPRKSTPATSRTRTPSA